ncbi:hypothetical protein AAG570_008899 [Ranatra chinensis]|uniref:Uncharacterized protein n=1 Tax=Ranatra chinensis TaxID=642074 RepID=A0ABD0Z2W3_9HEMI
MASKRRNIFYQNKKRETTEIDVAECAMCIGGAWWGGDSAIGASPPIRLRCLCPGQSVMALAQRRWMGINLPRGDTSRDVSPIDSPVNILCGTQKTTPTGLVTSLDLTMELILFGDVSAVTIVRYEGDLCRRWQHMTAQENIFPES